MKCIIYIMDPKHYRFSSSNEINISYSGLNSINNINHQRPQSIHKMSLAHCKLQSLKGIEAYINLQSLNLKFNNLQAPQQILRIPNKQKLRQLNLEGNTIEYYSNCTYYSLRNQGFDNLVILNNKNYQKWGKNRKKVANMKGLTSKLQKLGKSLSKTLKKVVRDNVACKYKLATQIQATEQDELTTSRQSEKHLTIYSNKGKQNSHQISPLRQISLSNVNMIKSVKGNSSDQKGEKGNKNLNQLIIQPIQFNENHINHMPLTQPTATFASQRQKQSMPFKSRNNCKSLINLVLEDQQELGEDDEDDQIFAMNDYQSFSRGRPYISASNIAALQQTDYNPTEHIYNISQAIYLKNLCLKVFKALRPSNMPRRISYV